MKIKTCFLFIFILLINSAAIKSQSFTVINPHDSLLFDGNDDINFNSFLDGKCNLKPVGVVGVVTGTYLVDTILNVCGAKKQGKVQITGQLHRNVELVPGYDIVLSKPDPKDEPYSAVTITGLSEEPFVGMITITHEAIVHINKDCSIQLKQGVA
jgi:hypothetical protein